MAQQKNTTEPRQYTPAEELAHEYLTASWMVRSARESVERTLKGINDALERKMVDVSRLSEAFVAGNMKGTRVASGVQHELLWGLANMSLDTLTDSAAEYDSAVKGFEELKAKVDAVPSDEVTEHFTDIVLRVNNA